VRFQDIIYIILKYKVSRWHASTLGFWASVMQFSCNKAITRMVTERTIMLQLKRRNRPTGDPRLVSRSSVTWETVASSKVGRTPLFLFYNTRMFFSDQIFILWQRRRSQNHWTWKLPEYMQMGCFHEKCWIMKIWIEVCRGDSSTKLLHLTILKIESEICV